MSCTERNKGKLLYWGDVTEDNCKSLLEELEVEIPKEYSSYEEYIRDSWVIPQVMILGDKLYKVTWEVKRDIEEYFFAEVEVNADGTIDFHTMHYNGSGSVEEVIMDALESKYGGDL